MTTETDEAARTYDPGDPDTWREVEAAVAKNEAVTVDLEALGELTPSQIRNIKEIRRRATKGRHDSFRVTRFTVDLWAGGRAYVVIEGTRTDCDRYSPRAIFSAVEGRFLLGRCGGVEVHTSPLRDSTTKRDLKRRPFIYGFRHGV